MIIASVSIIVLGSGCLIFLFSRRLSEIKGLSYEELGKKITLEPSPFHEIEEKIFAPAALWLSRHLPLAVLKSCQYAVNEIRTALLRLASALSGIQDYLNGRKISLTGVRKSEYWTEIHNEVKSGGNNAAEKKE